MKIGFAFDDLYPARNRAGRHIETLVRRFQDRGHDVTVITTPNEDAQEPEGIELLRLRDAPGAKGHGRSDSLMGKAITRFLKQNEVQVLFAEGLTPLSAISVKAAQRADIKAILRVLSDAQGIVHSIGGERKLTPSALKKRVSTMLDYTDVAAASSSRCEQLLREFYDGDVRIIEKCVDMNVMQFERVRGSDVDAFRDQHDIGDRRILLYTRDEMRTDSILATLPLMAALSEGDDAPVYVIAGRVDDPDRLVEEIDKAGLADAYRVTGLLDQRDLHTAYAAADIYLAPADSRASESELLEAMAMRCALAIFGAADDGDAIATFVNDETVMLDADDPAAAAAAVTGLLADGDRLGALQDGALERARTKDIGLAVQQVHHLAEELLGLPATDFDAPPSEPAGDDGAEEEDSVDEIMDEVAEETAAELVASARDEDDESEDAEEEDADDRRPEPADDDESEEAESSDEEEGRERRPRRRRGRRRGRRARAEDDEAVESAEGEAETAEAEGESEAEYLDDAGKRLRDLDPKLTLRDLLPFLRPPKDVFVMSIPSGSGQHRAGEAIAEAFKVTDQNLRVRQINILDYVSRAYSAEDTARVLDELRVSPSLFGNPFETGAPAGVENPEETRATFFEKVFGEKMRSLILERRPDTVVLTHWLPLRFIAALKEEHELRLKICVAVTDYDYHPHWTAEGVDQYLVPTEKVRFKMVRAGVASNLIDVVGIPVHSRFQEDVESGAARRALGIRGQGPVILLRPGGIGPTEQIVETIEQIIGVGASFTLLVLAGKNEGLQSAVKELKTPRGVSIKTFGFVDNIHEIMAAADLMITRASGHTVAEAFAAGLPMILLRPVPGIEERTSDWFVERGVAVKAHDSVDLEWSLNDLLRNNARALRHMRDAASNGGRSRTGAAQLTVERIARQTH